VSVQFVLTLFGTLISVLLAVAGGIGAWAALRVGRNAQVINNFRVNAESWEKVAGSRQAEKEELEQELAEVRNENGQLRQELAIVKGRVQVLTELVNTAIRGMAASTPKEVMDKIDGLMEAIEGKKK
jgi:hypothetical protein